MISSCSKLCDLVPQHQVHRNEYDVRVFAKLAVGAKYKRMVAAEAVLTCSCFPPGKMIPRSFSSCLFHIVLLPSRRRRRGPQRFKHSLNHALGAASLIVRRRFRESSVCV